MLSQSRLSSLSEVRRTLQRSVSFCCGLLLILAALTKVADLPLFARAMVRLVSGSDSSAQLPLWGLWFSVGVFAVEATVGIALVLRPYCSPGRCLAALVFGTFALIHAARLVPPPTSACGCFGLLQAAVFLRPFASPSSALLTNLFLAAALLVPLVPFDLRGRSISSMFEEEWAWLYGSLCLVGSLLAHHQHAAGR